MNDPAFVRRLERLGDLPRNGQRLDAHVNTLNPTHKEQVMAFMLVRSKVRDFNT